MQALQGRVDSKVGGLRGWGGSLRQGWDSKAVAPQPGVGKGGWILRQGRGSEVGREAPRPVGGRGVGGRGGRLQTLWVLRRECGDSEAEGSEWESGLPAGVGL